MQVEGIPRTFWAVAALTALAAALRFPAIDASGFWLDETLTVELAAGSFGSILDGVKRQEGNPPLYFFAAWVWGQAFGTGEAGLRSLSALFGTLTVPVAYLAGRELVSRRAGLFTAALVAVNPLLVWFSQEARAYAMLVFLGAVSLLLFALALRAPTGWVLAGWAAASALAVATHWFGGFLVAAEGGLLLVSYRRRRGVWVANAAVAAAVAALLPVASAQLGEASGGEFMGDVPLARRVVEVPGVFLVGLETPYPFAAAALAALAALVGLVLLVVRGDEHEHRGAVLAGVLGLAVLTLPIGAALVGFDYYLYRYVLPALVPLAVVVAAGFGARRAGTAGPAAAAAFCALSIGIVAVTAGEPKFGREDWRTASEVMGPARGGRAVVATPRLGAFRTLVLYLPASRQVQGGTADVAEIVLLGMARRALGAWKEPEPPRPSTPPAPVPGFRLVERFEEEHFTLVRFRAARPTRVRLDRLERARLDAAEEAVVVLQSA